MKVEIEVFISSGSKLCERKIIEYTVIEKYEDSVLAIPFGYAELMRSCEGKPTVFNNEQILRFIKGENYEKI